MNLSLSAIKSQMTWFSKFYRQCCNINKYKNIMMMIIKSDIAAQLLFLKQLIHEYKCFKIKIQCIQLLWKINQWSRWSRIISEYNTDFNIDDHNIDLQLLNDTLISDSKFKNYVSSVITWEIVYWNDINEFKYFISQSIFVSVWNLRRRNFLKKTLNMVSWDSLTVIWY